MKKFLVLLKQKESLAFWNDTTNATQADFLKNLFQLQTGF